jgi:hypothetical protein
MGWYRLATKVDNTKFADLWGWSFGQILHLLTLYSSILLEQWALVNTQLFGFLLSFIWLTLIIRIRIKHGEPVGLPIFLVLTLIKHLKKRRRRKKGKKYFYPSSSRPFK